MRSRASRAVTTAEPSSSPTSAQRPGKASSWAMRCHCRASTYRHMSRGYQARRARAWLSSPGPSWKTAPAVISASRWVGTVSQSAAAMGGRGSNPSWPASHVATSATSTRCRAWPPGSLVTGNAVG